MESNQIAMIGVGVVVVGAIGFAVYKFTSKDDKASPAVEPLPPVYSTPTPRPRQIAPPLVNPRNNDIIKVQTNAPVKVNTSIQSSMLPKPSKAQFDPLNKKLTHRLLVNEVMPEVKVMQLFLNAADKKAKPLKVNGRFNAETNKRVKEYMKPFLDGKPLDYITLHMLRATNDDLFDSIYNAGAIAALSGTVFGLPLFGL